MTLETLIVSVEGGGGVYSTPSTNANISSCCHSHVGKTLNESPAKFLLLPRSLRINTRV